MNNGSINEILGSRSHPEERLHFSHCLLENDIKLREIISQSPHLKEIELTNSNAVSNETISAIANSCKFLKMANFSRLFSITNDSIVQLSEKCPELTSINLQECYKLTGDEAVLAIIKNCPNMTEYSISKLTDAVLVEIANSCGERLLKLDMPVNSVGKAESIALLLQKCKNITHLNISQNASRLKDDCILVHYCVSLTYLNVSCNHLSIQSIQNIVKYLPKLQTLVFCHYNGGTSSLGNDIHDSAFVLLFSHFETISVLDLVACVISGQPRDRGSDTNLSLAPPSMEDIANEAKRVKLNDEIMPVEIDEVESDVEDEVEFKEGDGCYGEDENFQNKSLKSETLVKLLTKCTTTLREFHINEYLSASDLLTVVTAAGVNLEVLHISLNKLSDSDFGVIADHCHNLREFVVYNGCAAISDDGIAAIVAVNPQLQRIKLTGSFGWPPSKFTEGILFALAQHCPLLQSVDLDNQKGITDAGLTQLASSCVHIHSLNVTRCTQVTDAGIAPFVQYCKSLREVFVVETSVPQEYKTAVLAKYHVNTQIRDQPAFSWW